MTDRSTTPARDEAIDVMRLRVKAIDADRMAAIVDEMVRAGRLDARSKLADARLDYGKPWDPTNKREGAEMLAATADNADYWLKGGRDDPDRDTAVLAVEQAVNAWRNAAYAMAEKLARATSSESTRPSPDFYEHWLNVLAQECFGDARPDNWVAKLATRVRELNGIADHAEVIGNVTAALIDLNATYDGNRVTFTFESTNNAMSYIQKARSIVAERLELIRRKP